MTQEPYLCFFWDGKAYVVANNDPVSTLVSLNVKLGEPLCNPEHSPGLLSAFIREYFTWYAAQFACLTSHPARLLSSRLASTAFVRFTA